MSVSTPWYNNQAVQSMALGTDGGDGCTPNYTMKFYRY